MIELLIVIAIIGILAVIFGWNMLQSIRAAELREAATQVATDFRKARSQSQRGSVNASLELPKTTAGNSYTASGVLKTLPNNTTIICKTTCGTASTTTVTYQAPYGELLGATGNVFTISSLSGGVDPLEVRIVGVTGKVILTRAVP